MIVVSGCWQSPRKPCYSGFSPELGHIIGTALPQHTGDGSSLPGAGELGPSWPLQEGDSCCSLDGIHLQLPQGSTSWGEHLCRCSSVWLACLFNVVPWCFIFQGGEELVGAAGAGRPSHRWPPVPSALTCCQGMCSHLLLPVSFTSPCVFACWIVLSQTFACCSLGGSLRMPVRSCRRRARNVSWSCCHIPYCLSGQKHTNALWTWSRSGWKLV